MNFNKNILPHLVCIGVFYLVTILLFKPVILKNKELSQHDIRQWEGASKELRDFRESTGEEPLWVDAMFSGMPAFQVNTEYSDKIIIYSKVIASLGLPHPVRNIFLAFVSFYIMLLVFRVNPYLALPFALSFGLSSYMIIGLMAGHNARIGAIAFLPLVFAGIHFTLTRKNLLGGMALTTLGVSMHLRENHPQITYYILLILVFYGSAQLYKFYKENNINIFLKRVGILAIAGIIGLGTFFGKFWTTLEYSSYSIRGKSELSAQVLGGKSEDGLSREYAFEYSNGILEPMTLLIPDFYGGASSNYLVNDEESATLEALVRSGQQQQAQQLAQFTSSYWGNQRLSAPYYAGAIIVLFALMGFFYLEKPDRIWLGLVILFGIVLSWGSSFSSFNYFMFDYFPAYNKFRSVTFAILLPLFALPLMGALTLQKLVEMEWSKKGQKTFFIASGLTVGICLLVALFAGFASFTKTGEGQLPAWFLNALQSDRETLMRSDAFRSFGLTLVASVIIWLYLKRAIKFNILIVILSFLIFGDLFTVSNRYLTENTFVRAGSSRIMMTEADQVILQDKSEYRVYNIRGNAWAESETSYFHQSIGGYHGAKLRIYQEFYDHCISSQTQEMISTLQQGSTDLGFASGINMLNVKYLKFGDSQQEIIANQSAYGPVWLASSVISAGTADEELSNTCGISDKETAVINTTKFKLGKEQYGTSGNISLENKQPGKLTYSADLDTEGLAVFSEIYYPKGWMATIDGKEAEIIRANYILRALEIPAGQHTIEFNFKPRSYILGNSITLVSSIILVLLVLGALTKSYVIKTKVETSQEN